MSLLSIIPVVGDLLDKFIADPKDKIAAKLELAKIADQEAARESAERIAQTEVNKVEAGHSSIFVAGWRPGVGWMCVLATGYNLVLAPWAGLPVADTVLFRDVLLGMLGISVGARTIEKVKGVAENTLAPSKVTVTPIALPVKEKRDFGQKVKDAVWPF